MVDDGDVGLVSFDDIGEEPGVGVDVLVEFTVDSLETELVVVFGFALDGHDVVNGGDELELVGGGCFEGFDLLLELGFFHLD
jgi:hypothetical protein